MTSAKRLTVRFLWLFVLLFTVTLFPLSAGAQSSSPGEGEPGPVKPAGLNQFRGEYFPNAALMGAPSLVTVEGQINYDWGHGAPATLPADYFSARWTGDFAFEAGSYVFTTETDDGVRLWVDGRLIIDRWQEMAPTRFNGEIELSRGNHNIRMEYMELRGGAVAKLNWRRAGSNQPVSNHWRGEYFNNMNLSGSPAMVRDDPRIDFNWGHGAPDGRLLNDNFSVRWTRDLSFAGGLYEFTVRSDDGVRLFVDNRLVIDAWIETAPQTFVRQVQMTPGTHTIRLEYFERGGGAQVNLSFRGPLPQIAWGNIITCAVPAGQYGWVKVYRLEPNGTWADINPTGFGSIEQSGWVKIEGLAVDLGRFSGVGHPYKVEQYINGVLVRATGDVSLGQASLRVFPGQDSFTPWQCPK